jgi:hypothetical protein
LKCEKTYSERSKHINHIAKSNINRAEKYTRERERERGRERERERERREVK